MRSEWWKNGDQEGVIMARVNRKMNVKQQRCRKHKAKDEVCPGCLRTALKTHLASS